MGKEKSGVDPRSWDAVNLPDWMKSYASSMGYRKMTAVQASCLPQFLEKGADVVVEAVTGSGKTLAFLMPTVNKVLGVEDLKRHHIAAIVVSPTRELATQIHSVLVSMLEFHEPSAQLLPFLQEEEKRPDATCPVVVPQLLVGGTTTPAQDLAFFLRHSPNLLIATPGRLVELLASPYVHCKGAAGFEVLILDEADRLLDLGFKPDIQRILGHLPKQRRTGLFSASVSDAVSEIIRVGLRNPVKITVRVKSLKDGGIIEDRKVPASLQLSYLKGPASHKLPLLCQLLEKLAQRPQRSMIFLSTCAAVDYFQHVLPLLLPEGFSLVCLHGKHPSKPAIQVSDNDAASASERIRQLVRTDRALYDKASKAFVSWVRSYASHQAASIFRVADLDWADLGNAWGLLRLPKMPEVKSWDGDRLLGQEVDWETYSYKDKAREKQRIETLEAEKEARAKGEFPDAANKAKKRKKNTEAWSGKLERERRRNKAVDKVKAADADAEFTGFDD
ncbi:unnamed protein product [Parascedosporium putredinis]|uniref:ATP-dependent RNA helicase n=1 Tax=Parascedosporium putredinis TaxID=1442378 RepID=A0A9P1H8M4_9PEZI|nr:unnamed protein product [Parascedosporium putredinis]CAI7999495.1 unnamed protein product [Parascedosporium putredinis]